MASVFFFVRVACAIMCCVCLEGMENQTNNCVMKTNANLFKWVQPRCEHMSIIRYSYMIAQSVIQSTSIGWRSAEYLLSFEDVSMLQVHISRNNGARRKSKEKREKNSPHANSIINNIGCIRKRGRTMLPLQVSK